MEKDNVLTLIEMINDPGMANLQDISRLSFNGFLRRAEKTLSYTDCYFLYQQAVHASTRPVRRAEFMRGNPQLANNISLMSGIASNKSMIDATSDVDRHGRTIK
nr:hypothetical protein [uncultured Moellerella sp.]